MAGIELQAIDWTLMPELKFPGSTGTATSKSIEFPGLKIRMMTFSAGYCGDHWCEIGHFIHCLEGEVRLELRNAEPDILGKGKSCIVSDGLSSHRLASDHGATVLVLDGSFLAEH